MHSNMQKPTTPVYLLPSYAVNLVKLCKSAHVLRNLIDKMKAHIPRTT